MLQDANTTYPSAKVIQSLHSLTSQLTLCYFVAYQTGAISHNQAVLSSSKIRAVGQSHGRPAQDAAATQFDNERSTEASQDKNKASNQSNTPWEPHSCSLKHEAHGPTGQIPVYNRYLLSILWVFKKKTNSIPIYALLPLQATPNYEGYPSPQ